jgi:hypothetical protein
MNDYSRYYSGQELYRDDFSPERIEAWLADEELRWA